MLFPSLLLNGGRDDLFYEGECVYGNESRRAGCYRPRGSSVQPFNELLHQYGQYIIGRMGVPYREKGVNIISVALDAPGNVISALSGKIGRLDGITAKTVYAPEDSIGKEEIK